MKYSARTYILGIVAALMPLAGCTDNFLAENNEGTFDTDAVGFTATVATADSRDTRSESEPYEPLVLNADSEDYPLYLHTWEHPLGEGETSEPEEGEPGATRGLQVNSPQQLFDIHKSFAVKGDKDNGEPYIVMQNTKMINTGSYRLWTIEVPHRWPGNERLSFNAVAPYGHQSKLNNSVFLKNSITFDYTALKSGDGTTDAEAQTDLMMATATMNREETKDYNYRVPLHFGHALSAIKFAVRDVIKGKVVSIAIKGVNSTGHCVYTAEPDSKNGQFVWSEQANKADYKQVFNYVIASDGNYDPTDESQDIVINETMPEKTFMLIPQEIPDDAIIEAVIERDNLAPGLAKTITVRGKIKANNVERWLPGYEYVYTISTSKDNWVYVFDAEGNQAEGTDNIYVYDPNNTKFDDYGNTAYFKVLSYRYKANNQNYIEPLPWKASHGGSLSYNVDGGGEVPYPVANPQQKFLEPAQWITDKFATPLSGKGSAKKTSKEQHDLDFYPHFVSTDWKGDETMQGYAPYSGFSESNPYDLSTFGGKRSRTTANCYVIDRGGWYMFPIVYGNAVKNGKTNASAYTSQNTSTGTALTNLKLLKTMVNHNDKNITAPYITTTSNATAELIWQDAYDMIANIELVTIGTEKMIRFYVDPNSLQQGNAIIALKNKAEGTILWSWHIWATEHWLDKTTRLPHVYDKTNTNFTTFTKNSKTGMRERGDVEVTYNQKGRSFMMSPYNIGWCDPKKVLYLKRKNNMAFVQYMPDGSTKTGLTDNLPIIQQGTVIDYKYANNTYYQWGRKDPMRGYFNHEHETKRVFGPSKTQPVMIYQENLGGTAITIGKSIQEPYAFYVSKNGINASKYEDWLTTNFKSNLWNNHADISLETLDDDNDHADLWSHLKTVYDPCPAGYMVPNAGVWHVVQKNWSNQKTNDKGTVVTSGGSQRDKWAGGNWSESVFANKINGALIDEYNYKIWCKGNKKDDEALFFSSTGNRWWTDGWKPNNIGAGGNFGRNVSYAWSSRSYVNSNSSNNAYGMAVGLDTDREIQGQNAELRYYVGGQFIGRRAMGRPVRAIREP